MCSSCCTWRHRIKTQTCWQFNHSVDVVKNKLCCFRKLIEQHLQDASTCFKSPFTHGSGSKLDFRRRMMEFTGRLNKINHFLQRTSRMSHRDPLKDPEWTEVALCAAALISDPHIPQVQGKHNPDFGKQCEERSHLHAVRLDLQTPPSV